MVGGMAAMWYAVLCRKPQVLWLAGGGGTVEQGGEVVSGGEAMTLGAAEEYLGHLAWCATQGPCHEEVRGRRLDCGACDGEASKTVARTLVLYELLRPLLYELPTCCTSSSHTLVIHLLYELLTHTSQTRHQKVRANKAVTGLGDSNATSNATRYTLQAYSNIPSRIQSRQHY
jgi:hypothetical protein